MTRCTTWHVRIDLVDDGEEVTGRAELVGAPASMTTPSGPDWDAEIGRGHDGGAVDTPLTTWRSMDDLVQVLVDTLNREHHRVRVP